MTPPAALLGPASGRRLTNSEYVNTVSDLLGANVVDGKATRFSYGELAPIIDFDRTPGYRSSGWILPFLYGSLGILLLIVSFLYNKYKHLIFDNDDISEVS